MKKKDYIKKNRVLELADFFYSSDDSNVVPLRIAIITGRYIGSDLTKENFVKLFSILNDSNYLKEDLINFLGDLEDEK